MSRSEIAFARFAPLVRKGIRFRRRFEAAKRVIEPVAFSWYRYDSFPNLFYIQHLLKSASISLPEAVGDQPVLDVGAADGALSFFWDSLGYRVTALDCSTCNINRMQAIHVLATQLESTVEILDLDLDGRFEITSSYGVAFFLGTLYHLKNPFYALETIARHARYCFLSTRVATLAPDRRTRLDSIPVAFLLEPAECNDDRTNYFVFSPAGLLLLVQRAGWVIRACVRSGVSESDPVSPEGDERMFLLLESAQVDRTQTREPKSPPCRRE